MKEISMKVNGMHCNSCIMLINESLEEEGVDSVEASLNRKTVKVRYDDTKLSLEKIRQAIESEGYKVE